ncbi:MAG TPA: cytochrome c3 family protein [Rhodocyclaceae bacterium]|nr:cytochrome c3 family protein [Rhodocyclaceae bacterium]
MNGITNKVGFTGSLVRLFAAAALLLGAVASQQAVAGIANTKHNLGINGSGTNHATNGTEEICVFCHTPHGSNTGVAAPLWNKGLPGTTYNVYNSNAATATSTIDGTIVPVGSVSLACLSCHDGTQAMDNLINAPGSGWGVGTGTGISQGYTWAGANKISTSSVTNLGGTNGNDLTNDHPIGIEYCGGSTTTSYTGGGSGTCGDQDFKDATKHATKNLWWVDTTGGTANREKTDMILYTRTEATNGNTPKPYVECASCHDPHVEAKDTKQVAFLRVSQANSGVCLSCHTK